MLIEVETSQDLLFDDGAPVRGGSALARLGDGWLVAQDQDSHGAWVRPSGTQRLRLLPDRAPADHDGPAPGPDLQAACGLTGPAGTGVLLLGSGATPDRCGAVVVLERDGAVQVASRDLSGLYAAVARELGLQPGQLDVQGVARNGDVLRWCSRGADGAPDSSLDVGLPGLLEAVRGERDPGEVPVRGPRRYALGELAGARLSATDAVALPDGRLLLSAAGGAAAALVLLDGDEVLDRQAVPPVEGRSARVQGLAVLEVLDDGVRLMAVVDAAAAADPSRELALRVRW